MEMDMENADDPHTLKSSSSEPCAKRFGIKNTVQTNFGDDYVFQIASSGDGSTMAVSLSSNVIKLYSLDTAQYFGQCVGHSNTIQEISYSVPSSPNLICSCSSDSTIRAWDTRSFKQVSSLNTGSSQGIYSISFGGSNGNLLAAGCDAQISFWDWRNSKQVACLEESHMEDVTQVRFAPDQSNKLISASVDGLLCVFDTSGQIDDDDHLDYVMNVGTSVSKIGFFGETYEKLWCLTHIETLSLWDWKDSNQEASIEDARSLASDKWNLDDVDYFVDCHYSSSDNRLWVLGGTGSGTLGYFPINYNSSSKITIDAPDAILDGGHTGVVRTVLPSCSNGHIGKNKGIFGWSGGEDGRICCWLSDDESFQSNRSWITSTLVEKISHNRIKNRKHPY